MGTILTAGETMAMITPRSAQPVLDAQDFRMEAGGAESNVAVQAAAMVYTAAPASARTSSGFRILRQLSRSGVEVDHVVLDAERQTGLYVKSPGVGVSYYRRGSAASVLCADDLDLVPLADADLVHLSGITAALSESALSFLETLIGRAHASRIPVSFDVNYRAPLWSAPEAAPVLQRLSASADIVFVGRDEAQILWGAATVDEVRGLLPGVPELVVKDGSVGAWSTVGEETYFIPSRRVDVVEAVGAGDAFAGGYLSALLDGAPIAERLLTGHDRAALALGTTADFTHERTA